MGELLFQAYACILNCILIVKMLNMRWKFREHPEKYLGLLLVLWVFNAFEWYMVLKAEQIATVLFQIFFVTSRFAVQYLFLKYIFLMCRDSFLKVFYAFYLSAIILEILYILSQLILPQFIEGWKLSSDKLVDNFWLLVLITLFLLICMPLIRKFTRFYRRLEIKLTGPSVVLAAVVWMLLCSGNLPNRMTNEYYGRKMALYIVMLFGGSFLFGALVFWNVYETEKRKKYFMEKQREFLRHHGKILEQQMIFSRKIQTEIENQLKNYQEGEILNQKEVQEYYNRLLEILRTPCRDRYLDNPILDELLAAQIQKWQKEGISVSIRCLGFRVSKKDTLKWMEVFNGIISVADCKKMQSGDVLEISMDTLIGKDVVSMVIQKGEPEVQAKVMKMQNGMVRKLRNVIRKEQGQISVDEGEGKIRLQVILDHSE